VAGSYSNFTFSNNDCSHVSGCVWIASSQASTSIHNLSMANNLIHDLSSQIGGGVHGDGLLHYYGVPSSDATQYIDGVSISGNKFYGDFTRSYGVDGAMTAMIFFEGSASGRIFNNDFSYTPAQSNMFQSLIVFNGYSNTHPTTMGIYNNSFAAIGTNAMSAGMDLNLIGTGSTITFKNNVMSAMQYCIYLEDAASVTAFVADYNQYNCSSGTLFGPSGSLSFAAWQGLGFDAHGLGASSAPSWVSAPGNEHLNSGAAAIAAGTNLSGLSITALNSDRDSVARGSSWDIGAYQFAAPSPSGQSKIHTGKTNHSGKIQ